MWLINLVILAAAAAMTTTAILGGISSSVGVRMAREAYKKAIRLLEDVASTGDVGKLAQMQEVLLDFGKSTLISYGERC